jgi:adenosylcobinamide-GDP ribazoletransferase
VHLAERAGALKRPLRARITGQVGGLAAAFRFLTCLPLPWAHIGTSDDLGRALPYFPLVGLALGALLVGLDRLLAPLFERPFVDFALLATLVLVSGGLHLDGLIDTVDGLFGPGPAERRLAAMRDSWAGPRGAVAALGQLLLQYAALAALPTAVRWPALLLAPTLGRWAIVHAYVAFPYARRTAGLSLALKLGATPVAGAAASLVALGAASLLSWPTGPLLLAAAWLVVTLAGRLAQGRLGGMSGDVYGAVEQVVETVTLLLFPVLASGLPSPFGRGPG